MQRCLRARAHAAAYAASGLGERDRAAVRTLTIRIVALQCRRHETPRDRIYEAGAGTMAGEGPVRLLAAG